jgi:hypothetical protein
MKNILILISLLSSFSAIANPEVLTVVNIDEKMCFPSIENEKFKPLEGKCFDTRQQVTRAIARVQYRSVKKITYEL